MNCIPLTNDYIISDDNSSSNLNSLKLQTISANLILSKYNIICLKIRFVYYDLLRESVIISYWSNLLNFVKYLILLNMHCQLLFVMIFDMISGNKAKLFYILSPT